MPKFDAPIAGQSLTLEPGNSPWEQPPLYADVQQALAFHLKNLSDPKHQDDAMFLLEQKFPLNVLVDSLCTAAVMSGIHTIDVTILISPVIHEYLKTLAESQDIAVKEDDGPDELETMKADKKKKLLTLLEKGLPDSELAEGIGPALGAPAISDAAMQADASTPTPPASTNTPMAPPEGAAPAPFIKRP